MTTLTYNIPQAAARLGGPFTEDWLSKHAAAGDIPHGRTGKGRGRAGRIFFTDEHLAEIVRAYTVTPVRETPRGPVTRRRAS